MYGHMIVDHVTFGACSLVKKVVLVVLCMSKSEKNGGREGRPNIGW